MVGEESNILRRMIIQGLFCGAQNPQLMLLMCVSVGMMIFLLIWGYWRFVDKGCVEFCGVGFRAASGLVWAPWIGGVLGSARNKGSQGYFLTP